MVAQDLTLCEKPLLTPPCSPGILVSHSRCQHSIIMAYINHIFSSDFGRNHTHASITTITSSFERPLMCIATYRYHPMCQHQAAGTAGNPSSVQRCIASETAARMKIGGFQRIPVPCRPPSLRVNRVAVPRGYCDGCIMAGAQLMAAKGLDPDVYANSMGVSLNTLLIHYPGWNWGTWR